MATLMSFIRWFLGKVILSLNAVFPARPGPEIARRPAAEQARLETLTREMAIYQFEACPFCVKVRRAVARRGLRIELRDAKKGTAFSDELLKEGGKLQVPCLRIAHPGAPAEWLYESDAIIAYLEALG